MVMCRVMYRVSNARTTIVTTDSHLAMYLQDSGYDVAAIAYPEVE